MTTDVLEILERRVKAARRDLAKFGNDEFGLRAARNLTKLRDLRRLIDELIDEELVRGRAQGAPWSSLGTTKQAAQQRYQAALARMSPTGLHPSSKVDPGPRMGSSRKQ